MTLFSDYKTVSEANKTTLRKCAPLRALVVDDDYCLLQVVHEMLEVLGFKVDSANGGLMAMRCLSQFKYDVMITDLQMPDMDGYELSGWLKQRSKDTKVIVMTGQKNVDVADYMDTGIVDRWMFKPFSLAKLAGKLGELVPTDSLSQFAKTKVNIGHHGLA